MTTFYRLLGFLRPHKRGLVGSILLSAVAMTMTVALPYLTGLAVERINVGSNAARLHERAARSHDLHVLAEIALTIVAVVLVRWALTYTRRMVAGRISL